MEVMRMLSLNDRQWQVFRLEDTFECTKGVYLPTETVKDGTIPFVTAKVGNNGISRFIGNGILFSGNKITIEKIKLSAYYQPCEFYCSHDVSVIWNEYLNEYNAQFIATMIMRNGSKYSYGRQAQLNVVKREAIMLPVTSDGQPDYKFMEDYIRGLMESKRKQYQVFVENQLKNDGLDTANSGGCDNLTGHTWLPFYVVDIFPENSRGKRLKKADQRGGCVPYVSSTSENNGIDGLIEANEGTRVFNDCISLANSGSVGSAFYEPFRFVASDHVTHLKRSGLTKWHYLFLCSVLRAQASNFNFNREINDSRLRKLQIMLPATDKGAPDYEYMEYVGKMIMTDKYSQYLKYLSKS